MPKIECGKVLPGSGCAHVISGDTNAVVMQRAIEHAKEHGIDATDPGLTKQLEGLIEA